MNNRWKKLIVAANVMALLLLGVAGCKKKQTTEDTQMAPETSTTSGGSSTGQPAEGESSDGEYMGTDNAESGENGDI